MSLGFSLKGFAFGLGLVPQPIVVSSPSSLRSLVLWSCAIIPSFMLIDECIVGRCKNGILMSVFVVINTNDWNKIINGKLSFLRWFDLMNDTYIHRYAH